MEIRVFCPLPSFQLLFHYIIPFKEHFIPTQIVSLVPTKLISPALKILLRPLCLLTMNITVSHTLSSIASPSSGLSSKRDSMCIPSLPARLQTLLRVEIAFYMSLPQYLAQWLALCRCPINTSGLNIPTNQYLSQDAYCNMNVLKNLTSVDAHIQNIFLAVWKQGYTLLSLSEFSINTLVKILSCHWVKVVKGYQLPVMRWVKSGEVIRNMLTIAKNTVLYIWTLLRE